jgi:lipopolysaccharide transport system ATP-binding protein
MITPNFASMKGELTAAAVAEPPVVIRLTNVNKTYRLYSGPREQLMDALGIYRWLPAARRPTFHDFHALKNVSLTVRKGDRVGIVGRNGAGKSTLLKLITGNFAPSSGSVAINGRVQALMQVGLGFHPEFSGYENIRSSLNYNGLIGTEFERALTDVVDFCELGEFLHQPMKTYSLGMQARLQFAAATAIKPDILIVDEVLGAGDAYFSAKSALRMRKLATSGCTLLLVSHATPQILQFCQKAIWLDSGQVVKFGPAPEVVGAYEVESQRRIAAAERAAREQIPTGASNRLADPAIPSNYHTKAWIGEAIRQQDMVAGNEIEIATTLVDGRKVFRWPSERGVKIRRIYCSRDGEEAAGYETGGAMDINIDLAIEVTGTLRCRYYFSFFNLEALRVAWITSPVDEFSGREGEVRKVTVKLAPLLLGGGDFILSTSVFDNTDPMKINAAKRYDLLARCLHFRVIEKDGRQSPVFHHPGTWSFAMSRASMVVAEKHDGEHEQPNI